MRTRRHASARVSRFAARLSVGFAACGLALACAVNPVTGESEVSLLSPAQEIALGRQGAAEVEASIGLVRDPVVAGYVQAIGERLARHSPRRDVAYHFAVADMAEPNAFALPGGWIYISRGLLAISNSEDELAGVIGHEIGHVAARHAAQRETRRVGAQGGAMLGALLGGVLGGASGAQLGASSAQVAGAGWIASYGRDQERQADEVGQKMAAAAGYDPAGITLFLSTLARDSALKRGVKTRTGFLDSHPLTEDRVAATRARARAIAVQPAPAIAPDREAFLRRIQGIAIGPDPRAGVIDGRRFLHTGLDLAVVFPEGWPIENRPEVVVAQSPQGTQPAGIFAVEIQAGSLDPAAAAARFEQESGLRFVRSGSTPVAGAPGFRALAQSPDGRTAFDLRFVAHGSRMLRFTGASAVSNHAALERRFAAAADSLRRLDDREHRLLVPLQLRVARARPGETLSALSERAGNQWGVSETAVANGIREVIRFQGGELVKVAVRAAGS
ncbi:MAG: M48 family metalloprotease [Myxococcota bacterium]|nr:M48 family metalloprotease [Myxococcota bacterium]